MRRNRLGTVTTKEHRALAKCQLRFLGHSKEYWGILRIA
jgi:hypothetical protein